MAAVSVKRSINYPIISNEFASCLELIVMSSEPLLKADDYFNIQVDVPENPGKVSLLSLREQPATGREKGLFFVH